jgi:hypothetical protein
MDIPFSFEDSFKLYFNPIERKDLKLITIYVNKDLELVELDSSMLLEHIPDLKFRVDYMESVSATPTNSLMA